VTWHPEKEAFEAETNHNLFEIISPTTSPT